MILDRQDGGPIGRAIRGLSYVLLAAGVFLVMPNLILGVLKFISTAPADRIYVPGTILASILMLGHLILLIPLLSIPLSALWVSHTTGDPDYRSRIFVQGAIRYAPVLALEIAHVCYALTHDSIFIPGVAGLLVMTYAVSLLIYDHRIARAGPL